MDTNRDNIMDIAKDDGKPVFPLADPVMAFIFRSEKASGLAMHGLANAILEDSGDEQISEIISMSTQWYQPNAKGRNFKLDIFAKTSANEVILLEVQLKHQYSINTRALIYAELPIEESIQKGDTWPQIAAKIPKVISINILDYVLRKEGKNFHQVAEFVYREEPREVAEGTLTMHNLELPKFRSIEPDYSRPLHHWLTAICRSQDNRITMREVVEMDANLSSFASTNPAFAQFVTQYEIANADIDTRREMRLWEKRASLEALEMQMQFAEGRAEGEKHGIVKGRAEGRAEGEKRGIVKGKAEERAVYLKSAATTLFMCSGNWSILRQTHPGLSKKEQSEVAAMRAQMVAEKAALAAEQGGDEWDGDER